MVVHRFKKIVMESHPVLIGAVLVGLVAGHLLKHYSAHLTAIVLMMIPPLNGIGGNIGSIIGARLTSALHLGTVEPELRGQAVLGENLTASWIMAVSVFAFSGVMIFIAAYLLPLPLLESLKAALVFFVAGLMITGAISFTVVTAAFYSFTRGIDPDNVVIPILTSVIDIVGVISLLMIIMIVGV